MKRNIYYAQRSGSYWPCLAFYRVNDYKQFFIGHLDNWNSFKRFANRLQCELDAKSGLDLGVHPGDPVHRHHALPHDDLLRVVWALVQHNVECVRTFPAVFIGLLTFCLHIENIKSHINFKISKLGRLLYYLHLSIFTLNSVFAFSISSCPARSKPMSSIVSTTSNPVLYTSRLAWTKAPLAVVKPRCWQLLVENTI